MDKPTILVVEDNVILQKVIDLLAKRFGIDAEIVGNGRDALSAIRSGRGYSMVLMDWRLPDMDGIECTTQIRADEQRFGGHIPIIAMTASVAEDERKVCFACGMDDFMSKPFTQEEFRGTIMRWLTRANQQCS